MKTTKTYNPEIHNRRTIRLKDHDYTSPGAYFVTICAHDRECVFGNIENGKMKLNEYGKIAEREWTRSSTIRAEIEMDEFVVMPNHVHGIVIINKTGDRRGDRRGERPFAPTATIAPTMKPRSLSSFVAGYKSSVTKQINQLRNTPGVPVWQRNYHEHIIRKNEDINNIRKYIINNPMKWELDNENPDVRANDYQNTQRNNRIS